jgi:hypothetical protein
MIRRLTLLVALAPSVVAAATAALGPFQIDVPSRGFEEHCVRLAAGEQVRYRYAATADVDFNIHYHRGNEVFYPVKASGSRSAGADFTAPQADTYCLMWERKGEGAARIDGAVERVRQ